MEFLGFWVKSKILFYAKKKSKKITNDIMHLFIADTTLFQAFFGP